MTDDKLYMSLPGTIVMGKPTNYFQWTRPTNTIHLTLNMICEFYGKWLPLTLLVSEQTFWLMH